MVADYLGADMVADNGLYFYDRETWELLTFVQVPWPGVNHLDFTPDGRYLMVTCESAGAVVKIDTVEMWCSDLIGPVVASVADAGIAAGDQITGRAAAEIAQP